MPWFQGVSDGNQGARGSPGTGGLEGRCCVLNSTAGDWWPLRSPPFSEKPRKLSGDLLAFPTSSCSPRWPFAPKHLGIFFAFFVVFLLSYSSKITTGKMRVLLVQENGLALSDLNWEQRDNLSSWRLCWRTGVWAGVKPSIDLSLLLTNKCIITMRRDKFGDCSLSPEPTWRPWELQTQHFTWQGL